MFSRHERTVGKQGEKGNEEADQTDEQCKEQTQNTNTNTAKFPKFGEPKGTTTDVVLLYYTERQNLYLELWWAGEGHRTNALCFLVSFIRSGGGGIHTHVFDGNFVGTSAAPFTPSTWQTS